MMKFRLATLFSSVAIILATFTGSAMAFGKFGFGLSQKGSHIEGKGTETLKESSAQQTANKIVNTIIPSGFVQFQFNEPYDFVIGYEHIPGETEIAQRTQTRTDITAADGTATSITQTARGEISDVRNIYLETPAFGLFYAKAAYGQLDVTTGESLATGSEYGNQKVNYFTYGIGVRRHWDHFFIKLEGTFTDYDSIKLTSDQGNVIDADIEETAAKLSIGYSF